MRKLIALFLLTTSAVAQAFDVNTTSSPLSFPEWVNVKTYTTVFVDTRKLKTSLQVALQQWPNEECLVVNDVNAQLHCKGALVEGAWSYSISDGFPCYADPRDPRKCLKIDGLKQKSFTNFISPTTCTATSCPPGPPPVPMTLTFDHDVRHFAMIYRFNWDIAGFPQWSKSMVVAVNGVEIGTYDIPLMAGHSMISISAAEGEIIGSVTFTPIDVNGNTTGALVASRFYFE